MNDLASNNQPASTDNTYASRNAPGIVTGIAPVVEVMLDDDLKSYGQIEIDVTSNFQDGEDSKLVSALPANIYDFILPVVGETVVFFVTKDDKYFYMCHPPLTFVTPQAIEIQEAEEELEDEVEPLEEDLQINVSVDDDSVVDNEDNARVYGETFTEDIYTATETVLPMKLYEGDKILQGRYGQSIRFTCKNELNETPWSLDGEDGKPVIAIRTGEGQDENLAEDNSFIYLLSDQSIDFGDFEFTPESANIGDPMDSYVGSQIVIGSDRLTFVSKADDISISSAATVSISSAKWAVDLDVLMDQVKALAEQLDALCTGKATLTTGVGPTGPGTNAADTTAIVQEISGMEQ